MSSLKQKKVNLHSSKRYHEKEYLFQKKQTKDLQERKQKKNIEK